jgi:DNA-binding NarL/FixJ family response regulator
MIKVALVEDDAGLRQSLAVLIGGSGEFRLTGAFPNAEVAIKQLPRDWPEVVLMDINLPNMSGIDCVAKLKEMRPTLQILMLTAYTENENIFNSLMKGAGGYLLKKTPPVKILEAIAEVHAGGSPMSNMIARQVVQYFQKKGASNNDTANLTAREHEILTCLAKGYQYSEIGEALSISAATVRTHLHNIYEKLHVRSRSEAIVKFLNK